MKILILLLLVFSMPLSLVFAESAKFDRNDLKKEIKSLTQEALRKAKLTRSDSVVFLPMENTKSTISYRKDKQNKMRKNSFFNDSELLTKEVFIKTQLAVIIENSILEILTSKIKLMERSKLKLRDDEISLMKEKGISALVGSNKDFSLKDANYFFWVTSHPIDSVTESVTMKIMDLKSGQLVSMVEKQIKINKALKIDSNIDLERFEVWQSNYNSDLSFKTAGIWLTAGSAFVAFYGASLSKCTGKDDEIKDNNGDTKKELCTQANQSNEDSSKKISMVGLTSAIIGGVLWWKATRNIKELEEEKFEKNYPEFSILPIKTNASYGLSASLSFRF